MTPIYTYNIKTWHEPEEKNRERNGNEKLQLLYFPAKCFQIIYACFWRSFGKKLIKFYFCVVGVFALRICTPVHHTPNLISIHSIRFSGRVKCINFWVYFTIWLLWCCYCCSLFPSPFSLLFFHRHVNLKCIMWASW